MLNKKVIFVIGPPGSGKDTQVNLLAEKTGFYKFITGNEGLDYIEKHGDDPLTAKQKVNYDAGLLYDPEWLLKKVQAERSKEILEGDTKGIVFSGSPRTLYEAENLSRILSGLVGKENIVAIEVAISEDELRRRSKERLVCRNDENHTFSTRFLDIKEGDKCQNCDGVLGKKGLDSEKEVEVRIQQYNDRTKPGVDFLRENYKVISVDGEQSREKVHEDIMDELNKISFI
ncbi:MAG: nucleoside monophosphate kinase [Patescibacteria group bacterium]